MVGRTGRTAKALLELLGKKVVLLELQEMKVVLQV
jgi:hypothetical protein